MKTIKAVIEYLENENQPLVYYILTFLAAITLRNFLEFLVAKDEHPLHGDVLIHFSLFYIYLALVIIPLLYLFSGEKIERVTRVVLAGFLITISVPIIDLPLSHLLGYDINYTYMIPEKTENIIYNYFLFIFGEHPGASIGMRLEILAAVIFVSLYIFLKTASIIRAALGGWLLYTFIWGAGAIKLFQLGLEDRLGFFYDTSHRMMIDTYLFFSFFLFLLIAYLHKPAYMKALIKDLRLTRVLHYELMVIIGMLLVLAEKRGQFVYLYRVVEFVFMLLAVLLAGTFSAITNNLADIKIDRITNPRRPSVTGAIPEGDYKKIACLILALALIYSLAAGTMICFLLFCLIGNYFIYSMPPLRLKRIPFFSKGLIALNCLITMLIGYSFAGKEIFTFPPKLIFFVLLFFTACLNFIDIKDYEGDKAEGIKTLPVMLGLKWSKVVIGLFFVVAYALFPYFIGLPSLLLASILFGVAIFFAINARKYREAVVFLLYLTSGGLLSVYLWRSL